MASDKGCHEGCYSHDRPGNLSESKMQGRVSFSGESAVDGNYSHSDKKQDTV